MIGLGQDDDNDGNGDGDGVGDGVGDGDGGLKLIKRLDQSCYQTQCLSV